jgi:nitrate/TMAO reductase-like tetraheme cytochrome c subunit
MWISVEEKTPEKDQQVLVYGNFCSDFYPADNTKSIGLVVWESANCSSCSDTCYYYMEYTNITHWQPITLPNQSPTNL